MRRQKKTNKRILKGIIIIGTSFVLLVSCGKKEVELNVDDLAKKLATEITYKDELNVLDDDMFETIYSRVDKESIKEVCVYANSGASAEQVAVIEAKDDGSATEIKNQLGDNLQEQIEANKDYLPAEVPKLEKPVLMQEGKYVILCVSDENEKAESIVKEIQK